MKLDCESKSKMAWSRRKFLLSAASGFAVASTPATVRSSFYDSQAGNEFSVLMPRDRVPLSFIIDDSTCLVNMGHFCTPQFAEAWPDRTEYQKPWQQWPREIPDAFVRQFGQWCAEQGVKGKYSIVPNPACVGWLDRELPGWSRSQLESSLALVRELMLPNWDIHPEMITHTRVIDLDTGRPFEPVSSATMENSFPRERVSVDYLASYLAYALRILKNCGLPCEGITTPGGFGNLQKNDLSLAVHQALGDVFQTELPHYFKYVKEGEESTEPVLEHERVLSNGLPTATVNVPAGTGDWFGGWQGDSRCHGERYLSEDGKSGRMAELIQRRIPAVMLCHWPGMYCNGKLTGFKQFQTIVSTLNSVYGHLTQWMKLSEMARYWAAKNWAKITMRSDHLQISTPLAVKQFTVRCPLLADSMELVHPDGTVVSIREVEQRSAIDSATCFESDAGLVICVDLPAGTSIVRYP